MVKIKSEKGLTAPISTMKIPKEKCKLVIDSILRQIKKNIDKIKSIKNKKYSLLSCIFLCFYQKKKRILDKNEINDFIKKEIKFNKNKIVMSCTKSKESIVTQKTYYRKLNQILKESKYFIKVINMELDSEDQLKLNEDFIISHKKNINIKLFGRHSNEDKPKRKSKIKNRKKVKSKRRKFKNCLTVGRHDKIDDENNENTEKNNKLLFNVINSDNNEKNKEKPMFYPVKENEKEFKKVKFFTTKHQNSEIESKKITYLNKKRKNIFVTIRPNLKPSPKENNLIMPKFVDSSYDIKINIKTEKEEEYAFNKSNINYRKYEIVSSSNKEISYINNLANQFVLNLKSPRLVNAIKSGKLYIKMNGQILLNYEEEPIINNLLKATMREYLKFCEYIKYLMGNKNELSDLDDNNDYLSFNKEKLIVDSFKTIKKKCSFIINKIIIRLTQFITEYDFIVGVIKDLYEHENNLNSLKELLYLIENNKNILCKENIFHFERILNIEFDNASNFFMVNHGIN